MSLRKTHLVNKPAINDLTQQQLQGEILKDFEAFLEFLKQEKINLPWKSINGYKMTYKGKNVGAITLGAGGWLDDAIETQNYILFHILNADPSKEGIEAYLKCQLQEIADLFMEQTSNKCIHCRPTCGCSQASGRTLHISGKQHENVCMNALTYKFYASGNDMQTITMCTPRAVYPPEDARSVSSETVKKLILARKKYITKMLATVT